MTKLRRPADTQPKTAYDYRRYVTLVQVIALNDAKALEELCRQWEVEAPEYCNAEGEWRFDSWSAITRLAQHAIDYHRVGRA